MNKTVASTLDPVEIAAEHFLAGGAEMFEFMIEAAFVVGRRVNGKLIEGETIRLGKRINRSPDTIERFAKGGRLWNEMLKYHPSDAEVLREALDWQYWKVLAQLWSVNVVSLAGAKNWLEEAHSNKWEYEKFIRKLPTIGGKSVWKKSARTWMKQSKEFMNAELINAPAFDVDPKQYKKVVRAMKLTVARIEKAIEEI
jgi:hypothetical protein